MQRYCVECGYVDGEKIESKQVSNVPLSVDKAVNQNVPKAVFNDVIEEDDDDYEEDERKIQSLLHSVTEKSVSTGKSKSAGQKRSRVDANDKQEVIEMLMKVTTTSFPSQRFTDF
jgi:hypothetical protein